MPYILPAAKHPALRLPGTTGLGLRPSLACSDGIYISSGTISTIITDVIEPFHQEKTDIVDAGLDSTDFHHLDDTASRVNGKNHHAHILCNPLFTAYFTLPSRDRLAAIEVLSNGNLQFVFNEDTYNLMEELGLPEKRSLQAKEGRRPRPVVPGSLRAGCFAAGKI